MTTVRYGTAPANHDPSSDSLLEAVRFFDSPFRYFTARRCLAPGMEQALLEWFECGAPWRLVETDFYEQYEFSMLDTVLPERVCPLASMDHIAAIRCRLAALFDVSFDDRVRLVAHKLLPRQKVAIHNDYLVGEETHRLIVQLNRGLRDEDGGFFMLFNGFEPQDVYRILRPVGGSGIGFEIGLNSNHAVSQIHRGERYTLVYSFYARFDTPRDSGSR